MPRNVIKKTQIETSEWPGQPYRFKGRHCRWNADRFFNEYIISRCNEDDRDDDDRYLIDPRFSPWGYFDIVFLYLDRSG